MTSKNKDPVIILPRGFDLNKSYALQRLMDDKEHKEAVEYIVNDLCGTYTDTFDADARIEGRLQGRRSVGLDIVKIYKLNLAEVKKILDKERK